MRVISKTGAGSVEYPPGSGDVYEAGEGGVFDMPEPVGRELTTKHASLWVAETEFEAAQNAAELDRLRDPNVMVRAVNDLLKRMAAVEGKLEAPAKAKPEPAAAAAEPKKTTARKQAAAKQAGGDATS